MHKDGFVTGLTLLDSFGEKIVKIGRNYDEDKDLLPKSYALKEN